MKKRISKGALLFLVLFFATILSFPTLAFAGAEASDYLDSCDAYVEAVGGGDLEIWFEVYGTGVMDEIGVKTIALQESTNGTNWSTVKTFRYGSYPRMLASNKAIHMSYVEYAGETDYYYRAVLTAWAGKNGNGDSREITTKKTQAD